MDKNSIIGFVCIALVLVGFSFYQSSQVRKQAQARAEQQHVLDSIAMEQMAEAAAADTVSAEVVAALEPSVEIQQVEAAAADSVAILSTRYKNLLLDKAFVAEPEIVTLENPKLQIAFNTRGARPHSVLVKDYYNYDSTALYLFKPGECEYSLSLYIGEFIETKDFTFEVASLSDTAAVFRLPLSESAYIEYAYTLDADGYGMRNNVAFVGMNGIIPRNVSNYDLDFVVNVPRMEKGYKNESQYSKLDYYFDGDKKPDEIGRGRNASKRVDSRLSWFAFQQQFFSVIMRSPNEFQSGELGISFFNEKDPTHNLMHCSAKMRQDFTLSDNIEIPYEFYFGPNHYGTLEAYGHKYEKIIPLGGWLVGWFTRFIIIPLFDFLHQYFASFGLIILLMTIIIKIVVLPFTFKSFSSSAKMQALRPLMEEINEKYPKQEDAMKKQQATMELYKRAGVSPMGGCLPTLLTFPILWAMFRFFPASIQLRQQPFLWCKDLSAYDSFIDYGVHIPLLGDHLSLFALLMAVTMWLYSKMTLSNQTASNDPSAASMKFMSLWLMPIMMFFICNNLSAALSYYYLLSQLISILETFIIKKFFVHPDEIIAKVKASAGKPLPKSKFQQRLEQAQKMQEAQLKAQQKKRR